MAASDFFLGTFETALEPDELVTEVWFPAHDADVALVEESRRHGDYAMVGLAATAQADGKGLGDVRLAYFGVGNTPVRARKAETKLTEGNVDDAVQALAADLDPTGDVQATAATKKHLAGVLLRRVAQQLMAEP